jgi:hypothetical protein
MPTPRQQLAKFIAERDPESAADGLAEVVERFVNFGGTEEDYFASLQRLPSPLRELYAALIFNTSAGFDGLPFAIPQYADPGFMEAHRNGLTLLGQTHLLSLIELACEQLRGESSQALLSDTPNVAFQQQSPDLVGDYWQERKTLMPTIGEYLKANRKEVLAAASRLRSLRE